MSLGKMYVDNSHLVHASLSSLDSLWLIFFCRSSLRSFEPFTPLLPIIVNLIFFWFFFSLLTTLTKIQSLCTLYLFVFLSLRTRHIMTIYLLSPSMFLHLLIIFRANKPKRYHFSCAFGYLFNLFFMFPHWHLVS